MKKNLTCAFFALLVSVAIISCDNKKTTEDKKVDTPPSSSGTPASANTPSGEKGMTVSAAKEFLDASEDNSGKEITVTAYFWGYNERMDDKLQLNLGDEKLEGMQAATFSCMFGKDKIEELKSLSKDAKVTVTGKISKGAGGVELNECRLVR